MAYHLSQAGRSNFEIMFETAQDGQHCRALSTTTFSCYLLSSQHIDIDLDNNGLYSKQFLVSFLYASLRRLRSGRGHSLYSARHHKEALHQRKIANANKLMLIDPID